jgi:hypothetical protein
VSARPQLRPAAGLAALALLAAAVAEACPVCGGGNPANRFAFFASTIALSLLPLGLFVGGFLWLRSRLSDRGRTELGERDPAPRGHEPGGTAPGAS